MTALFFAETNRWALTGVQRLTAMQPQSNLIGLILGPRRPCVGRQIAGGGNQGVVGFRAAAQQLVLGHRRFHRLDGMEIGVFPKQGGAQSGDHAFRFSAVRQVLGH